MKKIFLGLFLVFGITIGLLNINLKAEGETFTFSYNINKDGVRTTLEYPLQVSYGQSVSIDAGTEVNYEYVGYLKYIGTLGVGDYGKFNPALNTEPSLKVTEDTVLDLFYKPSGKVAVILMDANHDYLGVSYTDSVSSYMISAPSTSLADSKPNLSPIGWTIDGSSIINFSTQTFLSDTVITVKYNVTDTALKTLSVTNGSIENLTTNTTDYYFNDVAKVTATGTGTFKYWLRDGVIASIKEEYTFTVAGNHVLEAIYDTDFVKDSDLFVGVSNIYEGLNLGYVTIVGQFDLPLGEELVEWGIITSQYSGAITFETPDVKKINSNKYNPLTNEFVLSFTENATYPNYRGFVKTINGSTVTTTYSYFQENEYASDLIISEYGESGAYKYLELHNGTENTLDLSQYSLKLYANGGTTPTNTNVLTGSLASGGTLAITTATVLNFNGNDAIELVKGGIVIDIIGTVGDATYFAEDVTLQRKSTVISPNATYNSLEWNEYAINDIDLGSHTMNLSNIIATDVSLPDTITINGTSSINVGDTSQLSVSYTNGTLEGVIWNSSDINILSVNENGLITAVSEGTATVTAYSYYGHNIFDTLEISVLPGTATTYTVTYNLDGGTNNPSNPVNFTASLLPLELSSPTKEGYTFDGWYLDSSFTSRVYSLESEQNYTIYAKWEEILIPDETTYIETFTNFTETGSTYVDGSFTGINSVLWTYVQVRGDQTIDWKALTLRKLSDAPNTNLSATIQGGISSFSVQYKNPFSTAAAVELYINNNLIATSSEASTGSVLMFNVGNINISGEFTMTIKTTNGQLTLDNLTWTTYGGATEPGVDTTAPDIVLDSYKTSYEVNQTVVLGCTAIDDQDPSPICTYTGTVDNTVIGDYNVTYTATDETLNTSTLVVTYTIHAVNDYLSMDLSTYYDAAEGLSGAALESALRTIVTTGFIGVSYGDSRYILDETDQDPLNPDNLILVYRLTSVPGVWDDGVTWNREHVWPQSLLGVSVTNTTINEGSDLHNLKPANPSENSSRGNEYYDNIDTSLSYEPPLESKGDLARILFYMVVRYENLELVDTVPTIYEMGLLAVLLSWHELDPVDDFERNRNEVIYSYQNNRNPFIDYPHLVELMFEDHAYYN